MDQLARTVLGLLLLAAVACVVPLVDGVRQARAVVWSAARLPALARVRVLGGDREVLRPLPRLVPPAAASRWGRPDEPEHPRSDEQQHPEQHTVSASVATTPGIASELSAVAASSAPSTISAQKAPRSPVVPTQIGESTAYRPAISVAQSCSRVHGRIGVRLLPVVVGRSVNPPSSRSRACAAGTPTALTPAAICRFRLPGSRRAAPDRGATPVVPEREQRYGWSGGWSGHVAALRGMLDLVTLVGASRQGSQVGIEVAWRAGGRR